MAIGTTAALLGSAVIGAGASAMSASSTNKAVGKASAADAALQRETYAKNQAVLSPYVSTGNAAMGQVNALLGLGNPDYAAYVNSNADLLSAWNGGINNDGKFATMADFGKYHWDKYGVGENRTLNDNSADAAKAFDTFRNSTGYQFRMNEGMNALNTGYAAKGLLNSGAAQKAALQYGQNIGSQEFGNYLGYLGNQQGLGLSGASALAGVGQNFANSMGAINNNAAQSKIATNNALLGNLSSSFGMGLGAMSSFGGFRGTGYSQGALDAGQLF